MIDIHCHILPVDDGAKSIDDAIEMARIAQEDGIKKIINTSHFNPDFEYVSGEELKTELEKLNKILREKNIDVELLLGNELYYNESLLEHINSNKKDFYTLNNSKYILLEFAPTRFPDNLEEVVYEFKLKGYNVILAHVERYKEVQQNTNIITKAIEEGAYIQVNASSILKKGSKAASEVCQKLLKQNCVHLVGSDAHGANNRRPQLRQAYSYIIDNYGEENAEILFSQNPKNLLEDTALSDMKLYRTKRTFWNKLFKY
ncbi:tyrosine-protein phosphatase [Romboutsia sp.]|uniref:tyrosine-protein phosphatase n=1 Tax=Romboutsia sp. TaxID=1965302 RepID=UPI003F29FCA6